MAAATILFALAAFVLTSLLPPVYQATALVVVTRPRYELRFDPRFETVSNVQPVYEAYPELALSDQVITELLSQLEPASSQSLQALRTQLEAEAGADPSLLHLSASSADPTEAARIANAWAELFVVQADNIYGNTEQARFIEEQLAESEQELAAAEQALVDFQAENQAAIIKNWLNSYQLSHADYLTKQLAIDYLLQDGNSLRSQLANAPPANSAALTSEIALLMLQARAFADDSELPLQLQISDATNLATQDTAEQIAFLDSLITSLQARSAEIDNWLTAAEPQILQYQQRWQAASAEEARLVRNRDVAEATYLTLATKLAEARIASQDTVGQVRLASEAAVPESPANRRRLLNTLIGGTLGFLASLFGVVTAEWWRGADKKVREIQQPARPNL